MGFPLLSKYACRRTCKISLKSGDISLKHGDMAIFN